MPDLFRSLLFVPGDRPRMLARAASAGADALVVDLEDAVPAAGKRDARKLLRAELPRLVAAGAPVFVRVNDVRSRLTRDDLFAVVRPGLRGVVHPKTSEPQDLRDLDVLLREAEVRNGVRPGDIATIPLIESPRGVLRCEAIADATDRAIALSIGGEDYAKELGVPGDAGAIAIAHLRYVTVTVAAARGMFAIDTPFTAYKDVAGLEAETARARAMGFKGKYAIHPDQLAIINRLMSPSREEVAYARRVIAAAEAAAAKRRGAASIDGRMIDAPVVERALMIIALSKRKSTET